MVKQYKIDEVEDLVSKLESRGNFILTNYSGIKVKELNGLRNMLRERNAVFKIVKNNLFKLALGKAGYEGLDEHLKGPIAVAFTGEDVGEIAKVLKGFAKENEAFSYSAGVLDRVVYTEDQIKQIADLPTLDVVLSQVMSMINAPTSGIAMGMNQVMASLARGINAVAEANNQ